jgi:hypothetical protein
MINIFLSLLIKGFIDKSFFKNIYRIFLVFVIILTTLLIFRSKFTYQYFYFVNRLSEVNKVGSLYEVSNAKLRENIITSRIAQTIKTNPINGLGYLREDESGKYYPGLYVRAHDQTGQIIVGDQTWGNFIAANGFLGLFLLLYLIFYPAFYLRKRKILFKAHYLFYVTSIALISEIITGFVSPNFNDDNIFKISFYIALNAYSVYISLKKEKVNESVSKYNNPHLQF